MEQEGETLTWYSCKRGWQACTPNYQQSILALVGRLCSSTSPSVHLYRCHWPGRIEGRDGTTNVRIGNSSAVVEIGDGGCNVVGRTIPVLGAGTIRGRHQHTAQRFGQSGRHQSAVGVRIVPLAGVPRSGRRRRRSARRPVPALRRMACPSYQVGSGNGRSSQLTTRWT